MEMNLVTSTSLMQGILQHGLPSNSDKLLALKNKVRMHICINSSHSVVQSE